jgi:hypothetical protein
MPILHMAGCQIGTSLSGRLKYLAVVVRLSVQYTTAG